MDQNFVVFWNFKEFAGNPLNLANQLLLVVILPLFQNLAKKRVKLTKNVLRSLHQIINIIFEQNVPGFHYLMSFCFFLSNK